MEIRRIKSEELAEAVKLVREVFMRCEAPDYGQDAARRFITAVLEDKAYIDALDIWGAFEDGAITGVLATRGEGHIALFFVDCDRQRRGIGGALMRAMLAQNESERITVNSSPFAVEVYRSMGFRETGAEQSEQGIRYTPMLLERNAEYAAELIERLKSKSASQGYAALKELEHMSDTTGLLLPHISAFADMVKSESYMLRVRGFRLLCRQARWDFDGAFDALLKQALRILNDEKPTAVRQALAALGEVLRFKPHMAEDIAAAAGNIDLAAYPESMRTLIEHDAEKLCEEAEKLI